MSEKPKQNELRIAVDIDGTLSRDTKKLTKLMKSVREGGGKVYLLTGSIRGFPQKELRTQQIEKFGVGKDCYDDIILADGENHEQVAVSKGKFCKENQIDIVFEDLDLYIKGINKGSPKTSTWLIRKF